MLLLLSRTAVKTGAPTRQHNEKPKVRAPTPIVKRDREKRERPKKKRVAVSGLPSCAVIRREAERMTWAQKMSAMATATPEQIAHGRRCLNQ